MSVLHIQEHPIRGSPDWQASLGQTSPPGKKDEVSGWFLRSDLQTGAYRAFPIGKI